MTVVRPKKSLGQHFLTDKNIACKIVGSLPLDIQNVLEIGPGMGVLTHYLIENKTYKLIAFDIDQESVNYLTNQYPDYSNSFLCRDFLRENLQKVFNGESFSVIGNFPYNISSQIFFKVLENRDLVADVVCMIQKEVAERIAAPSGSKTYGILSVLLQAYYSIEYLFTVHENVFIPPPKVKSGVIRLVRNEVKTLGCDEKLFVQLIKAGFNQRRKMLRNSIKSFLPPDGLEHPFMEKRPEQLSVAEFIELTNVITNCLKG